MPLEVHHPIHKALINHDAYSILDHCSACVPWLEPDIFHLLRLDPSILSTKCKEYSNAA
jgi:hypothetical protein